MNPGGSELLLWRNFEVLIREDMILYNWKLMKEWRKSNR